MSQPVAYILVGVPGSGKTTWISSQLFDWSRTVVASTDDYIEKIAEARNSSYSEVFKKEMPAAVQYMVTVVVDAILNKHDIVWDQTSTTTASRKRKFNMLHGYRVVAVVFPIPDKQELDRRLSSRPGKIIPFHVVSNMINQFQMPDIAEGFSEIVHVTQ